MAAGTVYERMGPKLNYIRVGSPFFTNKRFFARRNVPEKMCYKHLGKNKAPKNE